MLEEPVMLPEDMPVMLPEDMPVMEEEPDAAAAEEPVGSWLVYSHQHSAGHMLTSHGCGVGCAGGVGASSGRDGRSGKNTHGNFASAGGNGVRAVDDKLVGVVHLLLVVVANDLHSVVRAAGDVALDFPVV